ncbi:unnamed protein product [Closterium sp. NIES-53]
MPTRSGLDYAAKQQTGGEEAMEGDGKSGKSQGTVTNALGTEGQTVENRGRATGSNKGNGPTQATGEGVRKGGTTQPTSDPDVAAGRAGKRSDRAYRRSVSWQGSEEEAISMRWHYTMLPKVEVPERFSGEARRGPSLKNYLMQLENLRARWERDHLASDEFFRGLANTLTGEAKTVLSHLQVGSAGVGGTWKAGGKGSDSTLPRYAT